MNPSTIYEAVVARTVDIFVNHEFVNVPKPPGLVDVMLDEITAETAAVNLGLASGVALTELVDAPHMEQMMRETYEHHRGTYLPINLLVSSTHGIAEIYLAEVFSGGRSDYWSGALPSHEPLVAVHWFVRPWVMMDAHKELDQFYATFTTRDADGIYHTRAKMLASKRRELGIGVTVEAPAA